MVILTAKLSKPKLIGIICAAAAVLILIIVLANHGTAGPLEPALGKRALKLASVEAQTDYLARQGYAVSPEPARVQEVRIPKEWNEVYESYNAIQQAQGFDLSKYKGKTVTQAVYQVTGDAQDGDEPVYATLLLYKNKLIGADLSRGGENSFLRPLSEA